MNRDERLRRQEHDDGDAEDTVYVKTGPTKTATMYHADSDCHLADQAKTLTETTRRGA